MVSFENETFIEEGGEGPKGLPSPSDMHILIGIQVVLSLVGAFGNSLVLYLYVKRGERLTYVVAVKTLAVKDLIACCLFLPWSIALEYLRFATTSDFLCKCYHFLGNVTNLFALPFLVFVALDRCVCVCGSHIQATYHRRAFVAVGVVSAYSLAASIVPMLAFGVYEGVCRLTDQIVTFESILAFHKFSLSVFVIYAAVLTLTYGAIFGTIVHRKYSSKQPILDFPLGGVGGEMPSGDTVSRSSNCELATSGAFEGRPSAEEGRQLMQLQQEQISVTIVMFTLTVVLFVLSIPALLVVFGHIEANIILFHLYQICYVSNFFVYLCLEATFRKEVKELFQFTWSRLRSGREM